jgi:hypothetical protein
MRGESFDFISNFATMWQVVFGAILATLGGFGATQLEWHFERKRRERNAALFLGEVLSTLRILLEFAGETKVVGDPFGSITLRMLRSARREIEIYDRNRESLIDLADAQLRMRIHALILRITAPIENIFDSTQEIQTLEAMLKKDVVSDSYRVETDERIERLRANREGGFEYIMENATQLASVVTALEPLAHQSFSDHGKIVRRPNEFVSA